MDSKDLLMLAASVMRSISLIARPARWPAGTVIGCHSRCTPTMIDVQPQLYPTGLRPRAGAAPVRSLVVPGQ